MTVTRPQSQPSHLSPLLPASFIVNMLLRLPPRSLFRFKCVSKSWLTLISCQRFRDKYYAMRAAGVRRFLFQASDYDYHPPSRTGFHTFVTVDCQGTPRDVLTVALVPGSIKLVLPSCRGIFCLPTVNSAYLCNPAAHSTIQLPPPVGVGATAFGFGYAKETGEFKVVRLQYNAGPNSNSNLKKSRNSRVESSVFTYPTKGESTMTNAWRALRDECPFFVEEFALPVFVQGNETIYWKIDHRRSTEANELDFLVAFDINEERFHVVGRPEGWKPSSVCWTRLMEAERVGKVCLVETVTHQDCLIIWILADQKSSHWVKRDIIKLPSFGDGVVVGDIKAIWSDGIVLSSVGNVMIFYNPRDGTFKKVPVPEGLENCGFNLYAESLMTLRAPG